MLPIGGTHVRGPGSCRMPAQVLAHSNTVKEPMSSFWGSQLGILLLPQLEEGQHQLNTEARGGQT